MRSQVFKFLSITGFTVLALGLAAGAFQHVPKALADSGDGWLGVRLQNLDFDLRDAMDLDRDLDGVLVSDVISRSPADRAGIRRGDIITEINDEKVRRVRDVVEAVRDHDPGDKLLVVVNRSGSSRGLSVVLGDSDEADARFEAPVNDEVRGHFESEDSRRRPRAGVDRGTSEAPEANEWREDEDAGDHWSWNHDDDDVHVYRWRGGDDDDPDVRVHRRRGDDGKPRVYRWHGDDGDVIIHDGKRGHAPMRLHSRMSGGFLGVQTMELSEQLAEYFGTSEGEGVLVTEVVEDSPAASAGIEAGDIILSVDGRDIEDAGDLIRAVRRQDPDESVEIEILRKGSRRTLNVTLADAKEFGALVPEAPMAPRVMVLPDLPELPEINIELPDLEFLKELPDIEFHRGDGRVIVEGLDDETVERLKEHLQEFKAEHLSEVREAMQQLKESLRQLGEDSRLKHEDLRQLREDALRLQESVRQRNAKTI